MEKNRSKFKETGIGPIPEDWEVLNLERLIDLFNGKSSPARITNGEYPVYRSNEIIGFSDEHNLGNTGYEL